MVSACRAAAVDLLNGLDCRKALADVRACAMEWAHAGVAVDAMQHAVHTGVISAFEHVVTRAHPDEEYPPVAAIARVFVEIADRLAVVISHAYLDETRSSRRDSVDTLDTRATRLSTAKVLHVHPNTVDYRLERIARVTGLDPRKAEDLWRLRSAVVARLAGDIDEHAEHHHEPAAVAAQAC